MSLQRRLLLYLLIGAPLVWAAALLVSADRARHEVNELFDTEIIRLALQVQATIPRELPEGDAPAGRPSPGPATGEADLRELSVAVWDREGRLRFGDRESVQLPRLEQTSGFVTVTIAGAPWRVYYLQSPSAEWLVAAGQLEAERDELVFDLVAGQLLPWLLVLPVLLLAMTWAVRRALGPVRALALELQQRGPEALQPVEVRSAPRELQPLVGAMNGLFERIQATLERERRFTADAAHELRTPLAVLRAQWDVLQGAADADERRRAQGRVEAGLARLDRVVTQMLALARLEATDRLPPAGPVHWPALVEQAMSDVLPLAERRRIELGCDWPEAGVEPFPLRGDAALLSVLLRNLLDNAVRHSPEGSSVTLRFDAAGLAVENDGPPLPPDIAARLGQRFHRIDGQGEGGSGLGISIAQRVAALHGLGLRYRTRADGRGVVAELRAR